MRKKEFISYREKLFDLYKKGKYIEALKVAEEAHSIFKDQIAQTSYWLACLNAIIGKQDKALDILKNSINNGIWWAPYVLESESDFNSIRNREDFKEILKKCSQIFNEKQKEIKPKKLVFYPEGFNSENKYPLFIALHWAGGNAEEFSEHWKHVLKKGYILIVPQSSQILWPNSYCWRDKEKAQKEVLEHIEEVKNTHNIIESESIIAGASQGGWLAITLALSKFFNIKNFLSVIPAVSDISFFKKLLENARDTKGYIIAGEEDSFTKNTQDLYSEMKKAGIQCILTVVEGLGHTIPSDFKKFIDSAIEYLKA